MAEATRVRMTAAEYARLPETTHPMELINGEVIELATPKDDHQKLLLTLVRILSGLIPGGELRFAPMDVYLDDLNVLQPDIFWVSGPDSRCKLGEDGWWHGGPDLLVEALSPSTAVRDRREKFQLYEKFGVREYWLIDLVARFAEVWTLSDHKGIYTIGETFESPVLGGKSIEVKALFES
jgi:Uma2 family endonuclease